MITLVDMPDIIIRLDNKVTYHNIITLNDVA